MPNKHFLLRKVRNAIQRSGAAAGDGFVRGQIAAVNGDGTVQVNLSGDPTDVTAFTLSSYTPTVGDVVEARKENGFVVVHDTYATPASLNAAAQAAIRPPQQTTLLQGDTAFIDQVQWGDVPDQDTPLTPCYGSAGVTVNTVGAWTLNLPLPYSVGYAAVICAGDSNYPGAVVLTQASCTFAELGGLAYNPTGGLLNTKGIFINYFVLGA